jgi:hypothetical protein
MGQPHLLVPYHSFAETVVHLFIIIFGKYCLVIMMEQPGMEVCLQGKYLQLVPWKIKREMRKTQFLGWTTYLEMVSEVNNLNNKQQ